MVNTEDVWKPVLWIIPASVVLARHFVVACVIPGKYFTLIFSKTFWKEKLRDLVNILLYLFQIFVFKAFKQRKFARPAPADGSSVRLLPAQLRRVGHHL